MTYLVCASNCETCIGGAAADCTLCSSGYFAHPTTQACQSSCPNGYYKDTATRTCIQCDSTCVTCNGAGPSKCLTCGAQFYLSGSNSCLACDSLCDGCTGPANSECNACAAGKYQLEGSSYTCVSACSDIAPNYYLDGSICKACNSFCATCTGPEEYDCTSCEASAIEYVDSTVKNPKH